MAARYYSLTNTIRELPLIFEPDPNMRPRGDNAVWDGQEWKDLVECYYAHERSLREIDCHEAARQLWTDEQVLIPGVHYVVGQLFGLKADGSPKYMAYPIKVPVDQTEIEKKFKELFYRAWSQNEAEKYNKKHWRELQQFINQHFGVNV